MTIDPSERLKWLMIGADHGNAVAQFSLGFAYAKGNGVDKDYVEACKWLELAARGKHADAPLIRDALLEKLDPLDRAKALELVDAWLANKKAGRDSKRSKLPQNAY